MKLFDFLILMLCLTGASCTRMVVINNPEIMATNSRSIEIERIEISNSGVIFYMDAYNAPGDWVRIDSKTYLEGNVTGKQYKLIRSEGFELDKQINMPESGNVPFKLYFEPLDKKETAVEFIEGHGSGAFIISGIQLKEKDVNGKIMCRINGTVVDRPQSSRLMLMPWDSNGQVFPWLSVPIHDGQFDYTFYVDAEEVYTLTFYDEYSRGAWRQISFFAENGVITFKIHAMQQWEDNEISTEAPLTLLSLQFKENINQLASEYDFSAISDEMEKLMDDNRYFSAEYNKVIENLTKAASDEERNNLFNVRNELQRSGRAFTQDAKNLNEKQAKLVSEIYLRLLDSIKNNPSLPTYFELVSLVQEVRQMRDYEPLYAPDSAPFYAVYKEIFKNRYPDHPYTWRMELSISGNAIKEGGKYIDFTAPDASGKTFVLSEQIAGKVALIDLWASWCGPCRSKSISMIPIYEKYKDKGFTVVGVAREKSVADMVRAAKQDGYPWLTLVELNDQEKIWQKYGIGNAGGSTFLVDKSGTILAVNPTAEQMIAILEN